MREAQFKNNRVASPAGIARALSGLASLLRAEVPQYVLWAPVGLGAGIILYFSLDYEPGLMLPFVIFVGGFVLWHFLKPDALGKFLILGIALMGLGFMAAGLRTLQVAAPQIRGELGPVDIAGRVVLVEPISDNQTRVTFDNLTIEGLDLAETPRRIRLTIRTGFGAKPGNWLWF